MKRTFGLMAFCLAVFAPIAGAYEYPLQFTPNPGYRGLVVAGYQFDKNGTEVVGNCSYYTTSGNSGKGGGSHGRGKAYAQTCRWDLHGNLLSVTPGAPVVPDPISVNGSHVVYADNGTGTSTGTDAKLAGGGFVSTPGSHYTWLTPKNNAVLHQFVYTFVATLKSDGDVPVAITAVQPSALTGAVTLKSTTCTGQIKVDALCSITVTYDPTKLISTNGLSYDTLRIDLTSDAGDAHDFVQKFTIIVPPKP